MTDFDDEGPREAPTYLDSWKEIAAYLRRSVRTARRWEKEQGLPVRRHANSKRDSVYALESEIEEWKRSRSPLLTASGAVNGQRPVRRLAAAALIGLIIIVGVAALVARAHAMKTANQTPAATMIVEKLPLDWLGDAAISPDARFVAYTTLGNDHNAIRLRQIQGGGELELTPPSERSFVSGVRFSPDENWVYYMQAESHTDTADQLRRVAVTGGPPQTIIDMAGRLDWWFALSPHGNRLAYSRSIEGISTVVIANSDGTKPHDLVSLTKVESISSLSWSPDGRMLLIAMRPPSYLPHQDSQFNLAFVDLNTGAVERRLPYSRYKIWRAEWMPDGRGFVAVRGDLHMSSFAYPSLAAADIDTPGKEFWLLGGVANDRTVLAVNGGSPYALWVMNLDNGASLNQITTGESTSDGLWGVAWTADNRIVYSSEEVRTDSVSLWARDPDGGNPRQLTQAAQNTYHIMPNASPDGREIVFSEERLALGQFASSRILCIRSDGGELRAMTPPDQFAMNPFFSPDGRSILYTEGRLGKMRMMKMPVAGGNAVELKDDRACSDGAWGTDPSGRWIACCHTATGGAHKPVDCVMDLKSGKVKWERSTGALVLRWTPHGELSYVRWPTGASNVFVQPMDGRPLKQITNFRTGIIADIAWSPDERKLVLVRQLNAHEAFLLKQPPIPRADYAANSHPSSVFARLSAMFR